MLHFKLPPTQNVIRKSLRFSFFSLLILTAALLGGCQSKTNTADGVHPLKGVVVSVDKKQGIVSVKNEDMPGVMEAMTMAYSLAEPADLQRLHPNDEITADYSITDKGATLDNINIISAKQENHTTEKSETLPGGSSKEP